MDDDQACLASREEGIWLPGRGGYTFEDMTEEASERIAVELTAAEAKLVVAALRRFEPFWPADLDEMSRAELFAGIRQGIDRVVGVLDRADAPIS